MQIKCSGVYPVGASPFQGRSATQGVEHSLRAWADHVATNLVAREGGLVEKQDPPPFQREAYSRRTSSRPSANHHYVVHIVVYIVQDVAHQVLRFDKTTIG